MTERRLWVLGLVVLTGVLLRFWGVNSRGLWSDELFTASMIERHPLFGPPLRFVDLFHVADGDSFWTAKGAEQNPPLYELLGKVTVRIAGPGEWGVRLPSLLAGLLTLLWFALQAWRNRDRDDFAVYAWAFFLAATSGPLILYGQEARAYALSALFVSILTTGWYRRWRGGITKATLPGWGEVAVFILACHTHYSLLFIVVIYLGTYGLVALHRRDWRSLFRLTLVPLAFVPWMLVALGGLRAGLGGMMGWLHVGRVEAFRLCLDAILALLGPGLLLLPVAAYVIPRAQRRDTRSVLVLLVTLLCYVVPLSQLIVKTGIFHARQIIPALPIAFFAIAVCLARHSRKPAFVVVSIAIIVATLVHDEARPNWYVMPLTEGYREVAQWVAHRIGPDDTVVTTYAPNRDYYRYYLERAGYRARQMSIPSEETAALCERVSAVGRFAVIAHSTHRSIVQEFLTSCDRGFRLVDSIDDHQVLGQMWRLP